MTLLTTIMVIGIILVLFTVSSRKRPVQRREVQESDDSETSSEKSKGDKSKWMDYIVGALLALSWLGGVAFLLFFYEDPGIPGWHRLIMVIVLGLILFGAYRVWKSAGDLTKWLAYATCAILIAIAGVGPERSKSVVNWMWGVETAKVDDDEVRRISTQTTEKEQQKQVISKWIVVPANGPKSVKMTYRCLADSRGHYGVLDKIDRNYDQKDGRVTYRSSLDTDFELKIWFYHGSGDCKLLYKRLKRQGKFI